MRNDHNFISLKGPAGKAGQGTGVYWSAQAVGDLPHEELDKLLENPDALLWANLDRPVKLDHTSMMVLATLELCGGLRTVAYKRNRAKNRWKAFLNLFRSSPGHAVLAVWTRFAGSGNCYSASACGGCEPRGGVWTAISQPWQEHATYLATEWIDGAENLHLWAWALAERPLNERMPLADQCARKLGHVSRPHACPRNFARRSQGEQCPGC